MISALHELVSDWRSEAELLRRRGVEDVAAAAESYADELERALREVAELTVNLTDAAAMSGYSTRWLSEKVKSGEIPNAGRSNAPRIRVVDLPRKIGCGDADGGIEVIELETRRGNGLEADREGRGAGLHRVGVASPGAAQSSAAAR